MRKTVSQMRFAAIGISLLAAAVVAAVTYPYLTARAGSADSGQRTFGQVSVEPAVNDATGSTIYLLTPSKSPFPSKSNPVASAPMYIPMYPVSSTVSATGLNCQPTNCDHLNVLPFPQVDYGAMPGSATACADFNGGSPCSPVEGHDHLVGIASTGGDFNIAWHVRLVVFTHAAFLDGKINTRITTLSQIQQLVKSGDVFIAVTPITFNCSSTSEQTYELGTPVVIPFP